MQLRNIGRAKCRPIVCPIPIPQLVLKATALYLPITFPRPWLFITYCTGVYFACCVYYTAFLHDQLPCKSILKQLQTMKTWNCKFWINSRVHNTKIYRTRNQLSNSGHYVRYVVESAGMYPFLAAIKFGHLSRETHQRPESTQHRVEQHRQTALYGDLTLFPKRHSQQRYSVTTNTFHYLSRLKVRVNSGGLRNFEGGVETMYQPRGHLSQMHICIHICFHICMYFFTVCLTMVAVWQPYNKRILTDWMHTTNYMPFIREKAVYCLKNSEPTEKRAATPASPLNPPLRVKENE